MENSFARKSLKLILYMQRSNLKPSRRNRAIKRVKGAYPTIVERKYTALLKQWVQPMIDFTREYIKKYGEAMMRGDSADMRVDALPGGTFERMVSSLQGWAAKYIPDNPTGVTDGPSVFMGLGAISDDLFETNK